MKTCLSASWRGARSPEAGQITALLPLLTENYDLSNDVLYTAQKRGSVLLNAMLDGVKPEADPNVRWLLLVAHDTNIAMVRTLMNFSWQLPGYSRGNIPPGSSLGAGALAQREERRTLSAGLFPVPRASTTCVVCRRRTRSTRCCVRSGISRAAVRPTSVRCVPSRAAITALGQRIDRSSAPAVAMVLP